MRSQYVFEQRSEAERNVVYQIPAKSDRCHAVGAVLRLGRAAGRLRRARRGSVGQPENMFRSFCGRGLPHSGSTGPRAAVRSRSANRWHVLARPTTTGSGPRPSTRGGGR
uniref:(northern house mosquito) hypothetical protein n=1 Tax=Culex pipiens TaxID=7175 RepID=A0A8D8FZI3_CULPI